MSNILVPEYLAVAQTTPEAPAETEADQEDTREVRAAQLPIPSGWKILCAVPNIEDTFENSMIVKATQFMKSEEHATTVLFVVRVGVDAYQDTEKFSKPWCKEGDFVLVRAYSGTRFKIHGKEFRMINDDQVEGVVEDPRGYSRAA